MFIKRTSYHGILAERYTSTWNKNRRFSIILQTEKYTYIEMAVVVNIIKAWLYALEHIFQLGDFFRKEMSSVKGFLNTIFHFYLRSWIITLMQDNSFIIKLYVP